MAGSQSKAAGAMKLRPPVRSVRAKLAFATIGSGPPCCQGGLTYPRAPRATVRVKAYTPERIHHARALYTGLGMREVRQFWVMERDLNEEIDEPRVIEGVTIRPYRRPEDNVAIAVSPASFSQECARFLRMN